MNINAIIHTDIEPGVITTQMIRNAFIEQGPKGEAGRLMEEEEYDIHTTSVKSLRLEFLNILRIDHLWMLTGLTKLQLCNNIIEKIENLNELVNLVELDLSFNRITCIENLNTLVNIEILSLFQNKIKELKNIDNLKKLEIFTIGNNEIWELKCVLYLRKFKKLKSLNMAGNPCSNKPNFREYVAAFIPQLVYYEYKLLTHAEAENARNLHRRELDKFEQEEAKLLKDEQLREVYERQLSMHKEAFVELLDKTQLYDALSEAEVQAAFTTGQEAEEIFEGFKNKMCEVSQNLFKIGMEQLKLRQEEMQQFNDTITRTKKESLTASRNLVEDFMSQRSTIFYYTKSMVETVETQQLNDDQLNEFADSMKVNTDKFHNLCYQLWSQLMANELILYEQLEELNISFDRNLGDMINVFIELAQGYFTQMREHESSFMELITEHLLRYQTQVLLRNEDLSKFPPILRNMMVDKDAVHSAMAASHDFHLLAIDGREDLLVSRIKEWHQKLTTELQQNEIKRSRAAVSELNHFLDFQRDEFEYLHAKLSETYLQLNENLIETHSISEKSQSTESSISESVSLKEAEQQES